jgi:hypothetical protein
MIPKKVVIAGSAKNQDAMQKWVAYWSAKEGFCVLDRPRPIPKERFEELYPKVYKDFFKNIGEADIFFVANERRGDVMGYIGAASFSELTFALAQKVVYGKEMQLLLATMPDEKVSCYEEICLWKKLGWLEVLDG